MALSEQAPGKSARPPRSEEGAAPRRSIASTIGLIAGVVGTTAVVFGFVLYLLEPRLLPLAVANAVFGLVAIAAYAGTNRPALGRTLRGRSAPLLGLEAILAAGVVGLVVIANYWAASAEQEWDLTRDALFTLHDQSAEVARNLEGDVTVYGFFAASDDRRGRLRELVGLYRQHTSRIRVELIDPDRAPPSLLERFELSSKSPRIVVATDARDIKLPEGTEQDLTNALIQLTDRPSLRVGFVRGHRERTSENVTAPEGVGAAARALRDDGLEVGPMELGGEVDVDLAILAGPTRSLLPAELEALHAFVDGGGKLLVLLDPAGDGGLGPLLEEYGVSVGADVVVDPDPAARSIGFQPDAPVIRRYEPHPITDPLESQLTVFVRARSVSPTFGATGVTTLIRSSETSWAEADGTSEPPYTLDDEDAPGPIPIAVAVDRSASSGAAPGRDAARIVVFGDVDFATNQYLGLGGNRDLFANAAAWLLGTDDRITLRPKKRSGDRLPVTEAQLYGIMFFSVNLLPLLIVGFGFSVWAIRRRQ